MEESLLKESHEKMWNRALYLYIGLIVCVLLVSFGVLVYFTVCPVVI